MNVIEMQGVKKEYPLGKTTVHALKNIDFTVKEGDFLSIVGPSGSGKTTMLNLIGCIDHATGGTLKIHGQDVTTMSDKQLTDLRLHRIGFIFQTFNLIPVLTVRENVEFPLLLMKKERPTKDAIRQRVEQLADEPTADLDSETGQKILELMKELNKVEKTTFIFSTHDPDVLKYAKDVVKIRDGKIVK